MRGKYKQKKERQKTLQLSNFATITTGVNKEMPNEPNVQQKPGKRENPSVGFLKLIKTDQKFRVEVIAGYAGVLVLIVYALQLWVMDQTRKIDQRAWISVTTTGFDASVNKPAVAGLQIVNTGKTPARRVEGVAIARKMEADKEDIEDFYYPTGNYLTVGNIFPNGTSKLDIPVVDKNYDPIIGTPELINDATNKRIYFVIYGKLSYEDAFGRNHWFSFCALSKNVTFNQVPQRCSSYNDFDH